MKRALIIQLARLGDLLQTLPLCEALRGAGFRELDLVAGFRPWAGIRERFDRVAVLDTRELERLVYEPERFLGHLREALRPLKSGVGAFPPWDRVLCVNEALPAQALASLLPAVERCGAGVRGDSYARWMNSLVRFRRENLLHLSEAMLALEPEAATAPGARKSRDGPLVIHPGSGDPARSLPAGFWEGLLDETTQRLPGLSVLLTGSGSEAEFCRKLARRAGRGGSVVSLAGETDLDRLAEVFDGAALVVAQDTGALHLASFRCVPVLGLYHGSASAVETGPFLDGAVVLQIDAACHPCFEGYPECGDYDCRTWIRADAAAQTAVWILEGAVGPPPDPGRGCRLFRSTTDAVGITLAALDGGAAPDPELRAGQWELLRGALRTEERAEIEPALGESRGIADARIRGLTHAAWVRRADLGPPGTIAEHWHWQTAGDVLGREEQRVEPCGA